MTIRSAWHLPNGQTREDTRLAMSLGMAPSGPLGTRAGCVIGGLQLTGTAASSMQARLSPGRVWVSGTSTAAQSGYPVTVDTDTLLTFSDGHATLARVDVVVVRVHDADYDDSGRYEAALVVLQGTPASTPTPPALPPNTEPLYEVTVPVGASAAKGITWATAVADRRRYTAALGGIVPAGSGNGSHIGQYRDVNGRLERWDGVQWQRFIPTTQLGYATNSGATTSISYTATLADTLDGVLTVNFTAPPSGAVHVSVGARVAVEVDSASAAAISFAIKQGSTVLRAASDNWAAFFAGDGHASVYTVYPHGGLTPGTVYTATAMYRAGAVTAKAYFDNRFIRVEPVV